MLNFLKTFRNQFILGLLILLVIIFIYNFYYFVQLNEAKNIVTQSLMKHVQQSGQPHQEEVEMLNVLKANIEHSQRFSFWVLLIVIVFASGFLIDVALNLTFSLKEILDGIKEVEIQNLEYRIPLKSENEFGIIAQFFNKAIESVEKSRKNIEAKEEEEAEMLSGLNVNLRQEIARQTAELRKQLEEKETEIKKLKSTLRSGRSGTS